MEQPGLVSEIKSMDFREVSARLHLRPRKRSRGADLVLRLYKTKTSSIKLKILCVFLRRKIGLFMCQTRQPNCAKPASQTVLQYFIPIMFCLLLLYLAMQPRNGGRYLRKGIISAATIFLKSAEPANLKKVFELCQFLITI